MFDLSSYCCIVCVICGVVCGVVLLVEEIQICSTSPPGGNQVDGLPPAALKSVGRELLQVISDFCDD